MPDEEPMPPWAVRLETKVDIVLTSYGTQLGDHETRLRTQEQRRTVSPAQLGAAFLGAISAASGLATLINWLIGLGG